MLGPSQLGSRWIPRDDHMVKVRSVWSFARRIDAVGVVAFGGATTALLVFVLSLPAANWAALASAAALAVTLVAWDLRCVNRSSTSGIWPTTRL